MNLIEENAKFNLRFVIIDDGTQFSCMVQYKTSLFKDETINRLIEHYIVVHEQAANGLEMKVQDLKIAKVIHDYIKNKRTIINFKKIKKIEVENPRNEKDKKLLKIWQNVLNDENIGINDNFFESGGHSLNAVKLLSLIYKEFNVSVTLINLFEKPTLKLLSDYIETSAKKAIIWKSYRLATKNIMLFLMPKNDCIY